MAYLPPNQVAHYAYDAGFRGNSLVTAVAIAGAESTFNTSAINYNDTCLGLWQINKMHDEARPMALFSPNVNAKLAYSIADGGRNWYAWTTYTSGWYKKFWNVAENAAHSILPKVRTQQDHSSRSKTMVRAIKHHFGVLVNGSPFPSIVDRGVTYLLWTVLSKWNVPHKYLGNGKFSISGRTVQGLVHEGNTYLEWSTIPGIKVMKIDGAFTFTDSNTH
ncbi:transglycosylase SLT domain-containing protein [Alicyclobacillus sp. SP_1]|uniref:transglycosylase SLT domain-containing protein n=1 Tax=Alicyclobacillus sp. SP_1 TaxID=2942475 RepID=UPI0021583B72|nr:transglycosylase SLT domain-containing protein [Alicyclobacillus sp. SP_1]